MGSCCSMKLEQKVFKSPIKPPKVYYVNRKNNSVLTIEEGKFNKLKLPKVKFNKQCAIGYLHDGTILIAGGYLPDGRLSKQVFLINPSLLSITEYASLFRPSAKGSIFQIGFTIYYISQDLSEPHQKLVNRKWELITCNKLDLHSTAALVQEKIIYFLCGVKSNDKPTKKLYFLDFSIGNEYQMLKHKLNFKLISPVAYSAYDFVIVAGGKTVDGQYNNRFYIQNNWEWKEFAGPDVEIEDYPCQYSKRTCIFVCKKRKIVSVDWQSKILVISDTRVKRKMLRSKTVNSKMKIQKYRKNSRLVQEVLNNYVPAHNRFTYSNDNLEIRSEPSESESEENTQGFQSQTLSPSTRTESAAGGFQLTLYK